MTTEGIVLCKAALLFMGLNSIACSNTFQDPTHTKVMPEYKTTHQEESKLSQPVTQDEKTPPQENNLPAPADTKPKPDRLSPEVFPTEIIDFLSPKMFLQRDPIRYFLENNMMLSSEQVRTIRVKLMNFLKYQRYEFPSRYVPYAKVLWNLLNCQYFLENVKRALNNMPPYMSSVYVSVSFRFFSRELIEFFSPDVINDSKPPLRLILKLANTHNLTEKIFNFRAEIKDATSKNKLPKEYQTYAKELDAFLKNVYVLQALEVSVSDFQNSIAKKS